MLICVAVEAEHVEDLRQDLGTTKNFITKLITSWPPTYGLRMFGESAQANLA
jgi:hypothetical protein